MKKKFKQMDFQNLKSNQLEKHLLKTIKGGQGDQTAQAEIVIEDINDF